MDSTVISDTVNLAVRIEALTKRYGVPLLISQDTLLRLHEPDAYFYRLIDRVQVKGKSEPVSLFEVLDADPEATRNAKQRLKTQFETALTQLNFTGYSWRLGGGPAPRSLSSEPSRGHSA
jgi:adenylate cyclase